MEMVMVLVMVMELVMVIEMEILLSLQGAFGLSPTAWRRGVPFPGDMA